MLTEQTNKQQHNNKQQLESDRPFSSSHKHKRETLKKKLIQVSGRTKLVLDSQRARS